MTRAAGYIRVSTEEQANPEHFSLPAQDRACRCLAEARSWTFVKTYADEGESAAHEDPSRRPAFAALLEDARAGCFDVVIVHKLDRFSRTLRGALEWLSLLEKSNVALVSATEQFDFTTPMGRLVFSMLCAFSQYFLDNLRVNVTLGWDERGRQGYWRGDPPFGYCRGQCPECDDPNGPRCDRYEQEEPLGPPRELYVHPWESPGVLLAFETWVCRAEIYRDVADALNAAGYRTKNKRNDGPQLFTPDAIRLLLKNEFYLGRVRARDKSRPGKHYVSLPGRHEALVPRELWDRSQAKLARTGVRRRFRPKQRWRSYPLSGTGHCSRCGGTLHGQFSNGKRLMFCSRRRDHGSDPRQGGCDLPGLYAGACETAVVNLLTMMEIPSGDKDRVLAELGTKPRTITGGASRRSSSR